MTREKVKELLPILEAYANGKTIQYCNSEYHWEDVKPDEQLNFEGDVINYRIKPEPKYRPFNSPEDLDGKRLFECKYCKKQRVL